MHTEAPNRMLFERMNEAIERYGLTAQADFFAEHAINHGLPVTRDMIRSVLQDIATTFPDVKLELINMVNDGEWFVGRYQFSGTHRGIGRMPFVHEGLLMGIPPTNKKFKVQHIHMFRLKENEIVEHWANRDDIGMMRQLGLPLDIVQPRSNRLFIT